MRWCFLFQRQPHLPRDAWLIDVESIAWRQETEAIKESECCLPSHHANRKKQQAPPPVKMHVEMLFVGRWFVLCLEEEKSLFHVFSLNKSDCCASPVFVVSSTPLSTLFSALFLSLFIPQSGACLLDGRVFLRLVGALSCFVAGFVFSISGASKQDGFFSKEQKL